MSTGAWIFATAGLVLAVAAPVSYAAATSTVAIGNTANGYTAQVDQERQLVTVDGATAKQIVHVVVGIGAGACGTVYTPPSGQAVVVTQATFDLGSGTAGQESYGVVESAGCGGVYDYFDTTDAYQAQSHTYPSGLPLSSVAVYNGTSGAAIFVTFTGYLVPAGQLPPAAPMVPGSFGKRTAPARRTAGVPGAK
jgi:hypothetical protein